MMVLLSRSTRTANATINFLASFLSEQACRAHSGGQDSCTDGPAIYDAIE